MHMFYLFCRVLRALQQEGIMNVFFDDWKALGTATEDGDWAGKVSEGFMLSQAFTDQKYTKDKKICSVNWHPTIYGKVQHLIINISISLKSNNSLLKGHHPHSSFSLFLMKTKCLTWIILL